MNQDSWIYRFLDRAMKRQFPLLREVPEEKKSEAYGRAARLIIKGPEGGSFYLWFTKEGLQWMPEGMKTRNLVLIDNAYKRELNPETKRYELKQYPGTEIFLDLITGELDPIRARDRGLVLISGDKSLYDAEEFLQLWDKLVEEIFKPEVERGIERAKKDKK